MRSPHMNLHPNIIRLYLIKIAKWFMLYMPYVVPFYTENGLDIQQVMILQAVYSISIVALEIPSGYFADVIGRRRTLILGTILGAAGFSIYSFSYGFLGFLLESSKRMMTHEQGEAVLLCVSLHPLADDIELIRLDVPTDTCVR